MQMLVKDTHRSAGSREQEQLAALHLVLLQEGVDFLQRLPLDCVIDSATHR